MALYIDLRNVLDDSTLQERVSAGVIRNAYDTITTTSATTEDVAIVNSRAFAYDMIDKTKFWSKRVLVLILAKNHTKTVDQIKALTDIEIQADIDFLIPLMTPKAA